MLFVKAVEILLCGELCDIFLKAFFGLAGEQLRYLLVYFSTLGFIVIALLGT